MYKLQMVPNLELSGVAAATCLAVEEGVSATHATQPALIAVELLLAGVVLKELAHHAVIRAKLHPTVAAAVCHGLP